MNKIQAFQPTWPQDLASIGMSRGECRVVDLFLKRTQLGAPNSSEAANYKRGTAFTVDGKSYHLPRSLCTYSDGKAVVMLNSKGGLQPLGQGGQCTVKRAWELRDGRGVAKKTIDEDGSENVYSDKQHKGRGIADVLGMRRNAGKVQVLEYQYDETLGSLLERKELKSSEKLRIAQDLLHGLSSVHKRTHKLALEIFGREDFRLSFPLAHKDIKFNNILVKEQNKRLQAAITDFGAAGKPHELWHTAPYVSPELEQLLMDSDQLSIEQVATRNARDGQKHDAWAMGLILCGILAGLDEDGLPDIGLGFHRLADSANIAQQEIDSIIQERIAQTSSQREKALWAVAGQLLQTNPAERMDVHSAKGIVDGLLAKNGKAGSKKKAAPSAKRARPKQAPPKQVRPPLPTTQCVKKDYKDLDQLLKARGIPTAAEIKFQLSQLTNHIR